MPFDPTRVTGTMARIEKDGLGSKAYVVTPADAELPTYAKCVEVVATGDLVYVPTNNADAGIITVTGAPVGYRTPTTVRRVMAATTATVIAVQD